MNNKTERLNQKQTGYKVNSYPYPTKRYVQILDLKNDPLLIEEYKKRHSKEHYWPEIGEGIRSVGILEMDIFICNERLVMVVETPLDFDWSTAFEKLATLPRQSEWEEYMSVFQKASATATSSEKWQLMEKMFELP